ncbi:Retrovirus-related Pol polyprotein from transposon gypsy-like Protein [Tribolium castaneum]|uniref:Retrovirus-related Pol polyprotein from transposon gypsy-like Protein n=1 Tax=Tribolium castaneum TaxID=7070 RepID=D7EKK7_TRICA|nr:Retrovirus-related Pol polyprotein from transposon gypsy-like Protein [Tribolium castaneum]
METNFNKPSNFAIPRFYTTFHFNNRRFKQPNSKLVRWRLKLEEYDYDIVYKKGKYNTNADALSRIQIYPIEIDAKSTAVQPDDELEQLLNEIIESENKELRTPESLPTQNLNSPIRAQTPENLLTEFETVRSNSSHNSQIPGPSGTQRHISTSTSTSNTSRRKNLPKTKTIDICEDAIDRKERQIFITTVFQNPQKPKVTKENDVSNFINKCEICKMTKYERHPPEIPLKVTPKIDCPFQQLNIDLFTTEGKTFLTIIDAFTKLAQAYPIRSKNAIDISDTLIVYFSHYGIPEKITFDSGTEFQNDTVQKLQDILNQMV